MTKKGYSQLMVCFAIFVIIFVFFSNAYLSQTVKSTAKTCRLSDEDKVTLVFHALEEALNNPDDYNLEILAPSIRQEMSNYDIDQMSYFFDTEGKFSDQFNHEITQEIRIKPKEIRVDGNIASLVLYLTYQINNLLFGEKLPMSMTLEDNYSKIEDFTLFIESLNQFVNNSRSKSFGKVNPIENNNSKLSIGQRSNQMLVSRNFYNNGKTTIGRFTTVASQANFDNNIIFGYPFNTLSVKLIDNLAEGNHEFFLTSDPAWNRIIVANYVKNWLHPVGSYGVGAENFHQPTSMDFIMPRAFIVADRYNNRASTFTFQHDGEYEHVEFLEHNNGQIIDVASACFQGETPSKQVALLDYDNARVDLYYNSFNYTYSFDQSVFTEGSGYNQLYKPTSICYSKGYAGPFTYHTHFIFVADAGNNRIVRKNLPDGDFKTQNFVFPQNAFLTSIDTDCFGFVYVVDKNNATVYKFNSSLDLIAIYGSMGDGDKELLFPNSLKLAQAWYSSETDPVMKMIPIGDAFVTEYFGANTGIRRYVLGSDILDHGLTFFPRPEPTSYDIIRFNWTQSGATSSVRNIYHNGTLIQHTVNTLNIASSQYEEYWSADLIEDGYYKIEVLTSSYFDGSIQSTFKDSIYINNGYCEGYEGEWEREYHGFAKCQLIHGHDNDYTMMFVDTSQNKQVIGLRKLDVCGNEEWLNIYNSEGYQRGYALDKTSDGGYVIAGRRGTWLYGYFNVYVIKTDGTGQIVWSRDYCDVGFKPVAYSVEQTNDHGFILTGASADNNVLLLRLDSQGDSLWAKTFDIGSHGTCVKQTSDLGFLITSGNNVLKTDLNGDSLWTFTDNEYGGFNDIEIASDGNYVLTGQRVGWGSIGIRKLLTNGNAGWTKECPGSIFVDGNSVIETSDNGYAIAGYTADPSGSYKDIFVIRTNSCGDTIWTMTFPDEHPNYKDFKGYSVLQTEDDGFVIAGGIYYGYKDIPDWSGLYGINVFRIDPQPDHLDFDCGDENGDGLVNIQDITYLIAYLYKGGPPPDPIQAADVNSSCGVNILDNTYLINYLYKGGPEPVCPD